MILATHIILALTSILVTSFLLFKPTQQKLNGTYILFMGTLGTGTFLIFANNVNMLRTCIMGVIYIAFVVGGIAIARRKLAREQTS